MILRKLFACAFLVSLSACEEALGPDSRGPSVFVFDYTGLGEEPSDMFVAEGDFPPGYGTERPPGDWAFAVRRGTQDQRLVVTAARDRSGGRSDAMTLELPPGARRGQTLQFRELCNEADCAKMWVAFGIMSGTARTVCSVVSGQARVETLTTRRVAGSFSGIATCQGAYNGQTTLQRGVFDVAVIAPEA
jgi:hypothetical protein